MEKNKEEEEKLKLEAIVEMRTCRSIYDINTFHMCLCCAVLCCVRVYEITKD